MRPFQHDDGWRSGSFNRFQIAEALCEDPASLGDLFDCAIVRQVQRSEGAAGEHRFEFSSCMRANVAIIHALWRAAGVAPKLAEELLTSWPGIGASVAGIVDFAAADPFRFFDPAAGEAIPVAAVDEYLDFIDGRHFLWRKPRRDPLGIAESLVASEGRLADDPQDPGVQQDFLAALANLREPASHERIWLGLLDGGRFRPASPQAAGSERLGSGPADRQRPPEATLETNYRTKISINISLAARCMKRRALGLDVTYPGNRAGTAR